MRPPEQIVILNSSRQRIPKIYLFELDRWLRKHLAKFKKQVVVVFVSSAQARKLNRQYRGRNYPTDVLSFSPVEDSSLGELVFCHDVIRRQSKEHSLSFRDELAYLYIHGILHLLGYDHEQSKSEAKKMFAIQDRLFAEWLDLR